LKNNRYCGIIILPTIHLAKEFEGKESQD